MNHERGLKELERYFDLANRDNWTEQQKEDWDDFDIAKGRLLANLKEERFGGTPQLSADRAKIIADLSELSLRLAGMSFTDMCLGKTPTSPPPSGGGSAGGGGQQQQQQQQQSQQVNVHVYSGPSSPGGGGGGSTAGGGGEWDAAAIRELLTVALSAGELNDLCFDHFATVYHTFDEGMGRDQKIRALVGHCSRQGDAAMHKLLAEVQRLNPSRYAEYEPRLRQ